MKACDELKGRRGSKGRKMGVRGGSGKGKKNGILFRMAEWEKNFRKKSQREREIKTKETLS